MAHFKIKILNLVTKWRSEVSFTPPPKRDVSEVPLLSMYLHSSLIIILSSRMSPVLMQSKGTVVDWGERFDLGTGIWGQIRRSGVQEQ